MKTAIYIESGMLQLVITPESEFEKNAICMFAEDSRPLGVMDGTKLDAVLFRGSFYDCRGGWARQASYSRNSYNNGDSEDRSLIIRMKPKGVPA